MKRIVIIYLGLQDFCIAFSKEMQGYKDKLLTNCIKPFLTYGKGWRLQKRIDMLPYFVLERNGENIFSFVFDIIEFWC